MEKVNKNDSINIYELVKFSHIPEINFSLRETMEGIEDGPLTEIVGNYYKKVENYRRTLYMEPVMEGAKNFRSAYPMLYWFECSTFTNGDWGLTKFAPSPGKVDPYESIMPQDVIDQIKDIPVNPDEVVLFNDVYSPTSRRYMNIKAVKLSPIHICGTARLNIEGYEQLLTNHGKVSREELEAKPELAYHAFLYYLHNVPWFAEEFVREFFERG